MKKILLLLSVFVLFSCEQEDLNNLVDNSRVTAVKSRATSNAANFNPIAELEGIPVNVLNVGNSKNKYLSCVKNGDKVDLYNKDDNSLRQRWYLKNGNIMLVGGNDKSSSNAIVNIHPRENSGEPNPCLWFIKYDIGGSIVGFNWRDNGGYYNISISPVFLPPLDGSVPWPQKELFLQSESSDGTSLRFKANNSSELAQWMVAPIGTFKIKKIEYIQQAVTDVVRRDQVVAKDECQNDKNNDIVYHFTVASGYTESSDFNQSKSITTKIAVEASAGIPNIVGGKVTGEQSDSKTWSYGESKTVTFDIQRSIDIPIPSKTTMVLEALMESYDVDILYIATLQDVTDESRTFRVKGRWVGQKACELYTRIYDKYTKALMGTYYANGKQINVK